MRSGLAIQGATSWLVYVELASGRSRSLTTNDMSRKQGVSRLPLRSVREGYVLCSSLKFRNLNRHYYYESINVGSWHGLLFLNSVQLCTSVRESGFVQHREDDLWLSRLRGKGSRS